jgi:cell wall-associated NlpC family hydrolase
MATTTTTTRAFAARLACLLLLMLPLTGCVTPANARPARSAEPFVEPESGPVMRPAPSDAAREVVAYSLAQVHKRYCYGGTGPSCFDCSGLAQTAWLHAGARLPRTSEAIASTLPEVPLSQIRAGDILWWPGHVGIYIGDGRMVDALNSRRGVVERAVSDPRRAFRPLQ